MRVYGQIKDMMCDELSQISRRNSLDMNNLEVIYKACDIIKDIDTIEAMEGLTGGSYNGYSNNYMGNSYEYSMNGNSMNGNSMNGNSMNGNSMNGNSMNGYSGMYPMGYSFGRGDYAQRDNMGRYMDGYSRDETQKSGNTKEELKKLMEKAKNDKEKEAIKVALETMGG